MQACHLTAFGSLNPTSSCAAAPFQVVRADMVRFQWHVEEGYGAVIPPRGMQYHPDTAVQHVACEIEVPGDTQPANAMFTVPAGYMTDGKVKNVGIILGHGENAEEWKGTLLTELAVKLAQAGKQCTISVVPSSHYCYKASFWSRFRSLPSTLQQAKPGCTIDGHASAPTDQAVLSLCDIHAMLVQAVMFPMPLGSVSYRRSSCISITSCGVMI